MHYSIFISHSSSNPQNSIAVAVAVAVADQPEAEDLVVVVPVGLVQVCFSNTIHDLLAGTHYRSVATLIQFLPMIN